MNKKNIGVMAVVFCAVLIIGVYACSSNKNYYKIMAVTGATPIAVKQDLTKKVELEVTGCTKKKYRFDKDSLGAFATVYLRTMEVSPGGEFEGTYRYHGVPVLHILEGIAPEKPKSSPFDRPLDLIVTFISSSGKQAHFSYGELTMNDDARPVILAYSRKELSASKASAEKPYMLNKHKTDVTGLRLVVPGDKDTLRYLDDVKKIVMREPAVNNDGLPEMTKGFRCVSDSITVVHGGNRRNLDLAGVETSSVKNWIRTGHGQGFKGIASASGYSMRSLLTKNFPGSDEKKFFLFVACDGYRTIFSWREIFGTEAGRSMMLIRESDGAKVRGGMSVGPVRDYYVDRETWGLTHIVMLDNVSDIK